MKNKPLSIALACAIGAGLGTMLAIQFGKLWILGLLIGAFIGYLVYDLPVVIKAIPKAWKYAIENKAKFFPILKKGLEFLPFIIVVFLIPFFYGIAGTSLIKKYANELNGIGGFLFLVTLFSGMGLSIANLTTRTTFINRPFDKLVDNPNGTVVEQTYDDVFHNYTGIVILEKGRKNNLIYAMIFLFSFPLMLLFLVFTILHVVFDFVLFFPKAIWHAIKFTGVFFWKFFKLIHSDIRLLVGIDSFIGGWVGYHYHSILAGMVFGAVWGLANYWLVSIKWLKLKPSH